MRRLDHLSPDSRTVHLVGTVTLVVVFLVFLPVLYLVRDSGPLFLGLGISLAAIVLSAVIAVSVKVHKAVRSEW